MRIGHMGYMNEFDILTALAGLELALAEFGYRPPSAGAGVARATEVFGHRCLTLPACWSPRRSPTAGIQLLREEFDVDIDLLAPPELWPAGSATTTP